ncbi:MAG TPA: peptidylprolyl isomerase [Pyrinomonadaceae bacterium]|nr:peptidylprolyl isomerase [Pyrinomonadaceae bacterium]
MQLGSYRTTLCASLLLVASLTTATAQQPRANRPVSAIPTNILLRIIRAEDERRWNKDLAFLLANKNAQVRKRAALAAGRIGDERAVPALLDLLRGVDNTDVRQVAAFALGEIESPVSAEGLIALLEDTRPPGEVRAREVEALGKIGAALLSGAPASDDQATTPKAEDKQLAKIRSAILDVLKFEAGRRSMPDRSSILLGLTAVLRAKPEGVGPIIVRFLGYSDPRIVADALNALARLRLKDGNEDARRLLVKHDDPIVRANAARVLAATEDKQAFDALLARALNDYDLRVRVSAIRALGSLKDARAALPMIRRGTELFRLAQLRSGNGASRNEGLETLAALGLVLSGKLTDTTATRILTGEDAVLEPELMLLAFSFRAMTSENILEDEVARARIRPSEYLEYQKGFEAAREQIPERLPRVVYGFSSTSARAAGLAELGRLKPQPPEHVLEESQSLLRRMLDDRRTPLFAVPNILNAYAVYKPKGFVDLLRDYLKQSDVIVRATAAELIGGQPPDEANARTLIEALPRAIQDKDLNDAALAILDALAKQKSAAANEAIKTALDSSDHLIRRKAVALLKANRVGDFSNRIGTVKTRNMEADYRRAIARIGKHVTATVVTSKGAFSIEFLPEDAPLTVDNFIQLARKGYFNGQTIPRVVPNFVIQAGDPRGDTNGGPGYQIRCEINEVPYERAAVGMALSGKDTGGSQWFVTHSPQPHLDGGYTVFGRVIRGMDVVDNIARGDIIRRVVVNEQ